MSLHGISTAGSDIFSRTVIRSCSAARWKTKTEQYLAMFNLTSIRKKAPFNISGGEKKRCALAAILAMEPEVLILDEPYNNLDEDMQKWLLHFLESLKSPERLVVFADHHHSSASALADHFLYMDKAHRIVRTAEAEQKTGAEYERRE